MCLCPRLSGFLLARYQSTLPPICVLNLLLPSLRVSGSFYPLRFGTPLYFSPSPPLPCRPLCLFKEERHFKAKQLPLLLIRGTVTLGGLHPPFPDSTIYRVPRACTRSLTTPMRVTPRKHSRTSMAKKCAAAPSTSPGRSSPVSLTQKRMLDPLLPRK